MIITIILIIEQKMTLEYRSISQDVDDTASSANNNPTAKMRKSPIFFCLGSCRRLIIGIGRKNITTSAKMFIVANEYHWAVGWTHFPGMLLSHKRAMGIHCRMVAMPVPSVYSKTYAIMPRILR